jgi:uridine kinase
LKMLKAKYKDYFEVFNRIDSLMKLHSTVSVAIDGNSGAGKSTLAELIGNVYDCNIFHMDDFFLTPELKTEERLKEVGGNVDYVRFRREIIEGLQRGCEFQYRKYDCAKNAMSEYITVTPKKLNIIEGSYSMHQTLIDFYNLKIFLHINRETQSQRILKRNGTAMHRRFLNEWIPLENQYFEKMKIRERSDLVFEG